MSHSPPKPKDWRLKHVDEKEALENEGNESSSSKDEIDKTDNNATPAPTSRSRKSCLTNKRLSSKAKQAARALMMTIGCFTVQGFNLNSDQNQNIPEIPPTHDKAIKEHRESPFKIEKIDNEERLHVYHLQIHKINCLLSPEPIQN